MLTSLGWNVILTRHFSPKEIKQEPQNRLPLLSTARPYPLIPLTSGLPHLYWLGIGRCCLGLVCMLYFCSEFITFLAFTHLPLPPRLSNSAIHFGTCLALATWKTHGSLGFHSLNSTSSFDWALLWCGPSPSYLANIAFFPMSMGWLMILPCHYTALVMRILLFYFVVISGLMGWSSYQSIFYILSSFGLYWLAFLLGQPIPSLGFPQPISFLGYPWPISFLKLPWPIFFFLFSFTPMGFY